MRRVPLVLLVLAAAACGKEKAGGPAVTYPGIAGHTWLPLVGTAHEPTPTGSINGSILCTSCHTSDSFRAMVNCTSCHVVSPATWGMADADTYPEHVDTTPSTTYPGYGSANAAFVGYRGSAPPAAPVATDFCLRCHPQATAYSSVNHTMFPIGPGTKHNRSCNLCHTTTTGRNTAIADGTLNCVVCHMDQLPPPNDTIFPPPTIDERHLPASLVAGGIGVVLDYPTAGIAPKDCMRCHDPAAMAPAVGAGNLVLTVANHGGRSGPPTVGSAGPWDGRHGNTGQPVHCWTCHDTTPPLFSGYSTVDGDPPNVDRPWAQNWSTNRADISVPGYTLTCTITTSPNSAQHACCTACHGSKN